MFDIGWTELLAIIIVAIVVIGPKDLPLAIRTAGRWVARGRRLMGQFRTSLDSLAHEAEMEELEKRWAEQNAKIMRDHEDAPPMLPGASGYADSAPRPDDKPDSASDNIPADTIAADDVAAADLPPSKDDAP